MAFDIEKMNKLPREARFFDVNGLWYFYNGWMVRILYSTPITPNQITVLSFFVGLFSMGFYVSGRSDSLVWGAIFLYGKVLLDNIDGNLARVRGTSSRLGRFLDSLTDFLVTVMIYIGIWAYMMWDYYADRAYLSYLSLSVISLIILILYGQKFIKKYKNI